MANFRRMLPYVKAAHDAIVGINTGDMATMQKNMDFLLQGARVLNETQKLQDERSMSPYKRAGDIANIMKDIIGARRANLEMQYLPEEKATELAGKKATTAKTQQEIDKETAYNTALEKYGGSGAFKATEDIAGLGYKQAQTTREQWLSSPEYKAAELEFMKARGGAVTPENAIVQHGKIVDDLRYNQVLKNNAQSALTRLKMSANKQTLVSQFAPDLMNTMPDISDKTIAEAEAYIQNVYLPSLERQDAYLGNLSETITQQSGVQSPIIPQGWPQTWETFKSQLFESYPDPSSRSKYLRQAGAYINSVYKGHTREINDLIKQGSIPKTPTSPTKPLQSQQKPAETKPQAQAFIQSMRAKGITSIKQLDPDIIQALKAQGIYDQVLKLLGE